MVGTTGLSAVTPSVSWPSYRRRKLELPLGDLGTYHASLLPNAFAFDHYTHIRADLFSPRGPLSDPAPDCDELRLAPAIDWIAAALPQQNPLAVEAFDGAAAALHVVGQAAQMIEVGSGPTVATVTSDGPAFIRWVSWAGRLLGTTRRHGQRGRASTGGPMTAPRVFRPCSLARLTGGRQVRPAGRPWGLGLT